MDKQALADTELLAKLSGASFFATDRAQATLFALAAKRLAQLLSIKGA